MALASYYASLSNMRCHHGCVIILNGNVIAHGYNTRNYSKTKVMNDLSCHAEINALKNAFRRLKINPNRDKPTIHKMKVYIARINSDGNFLESKPCLQCYSTFKKVGIVNVIYSNEYCFNKMDVRDPHLCKSSSGFMKGIDGLNMSS
jgi:tRNA(Arg) A34 adenosine deaminase TadA